MEAMMYMTYAFEVMTQERERDVEHMLEQRAKLAQLALPRRSMSFAEWVRSLISPIPRRQFPSTGSTQAL
jgi:hypothetical protein